MTNCYFFSIITVCRFKFAQILVSTTVWTADRLIDFGAKFVARAFAIVAQNDFSTRISAICSLELAVITICCSIRAAYWFVNCSQGSYNYKICRTRFSVTPQLLGRQCCSSAGKGPCRLQWLSQVRRFCNSFELNHNTLHKFYRLNHRDPCGRLYQTASKPKFSAVTIPFLVSLQSDGHLLLVLAKAFPGVTYSTRYQVTHEIIPLRQRWQTESTRSCQKSWQKFHSFSLMWPLVYFFQLIPILYQFWWLYPHVFHLPPHINLRIADGDRRSNSVT